MSDRLCEPGEGGVSDRLSEPGVGGVSDRLCEPGVGGMSDGMTELTVPPPIFHPRKFCFMRRRRCFQ